MYSKLLPHELAPYFRAFPWVVSVGAVVYFVVTLLVEALVVFRWRRKHAVPVGLCRVILAVVVANAVTYSVLAPLHYFATTPAGRGGPSPSCITSMGTRGTFARSQRMGEESKY
jgi:hypothetical protein